MHERIVIIDSTPVIALASIDKLYLLSGLPVQKSGSRSRLFIQCCSGF